MNENTGGSTITVASDDNVIGFNANMSRHSDTSGQVSWSMIVRAFGLLLGILLLFSTVNASETKPDDIVGIWLIEEGGETVEKIEIYTCGEMYCGTIVWIKPSEGTGKTEEIRRDEKNKKKELRSRPLLGLEALKDYKFDGKDSWRDGEFYAHRKGKTVSPTLTLIDDDRLRIQIKFLFVKKSFIWKRDVSSEQDNE
ncbi:DUF2147 domain-containing protein [bacterium AH-315-J21]|nr:DUF2147 domain-containing protein [bacterium AH-315-J21]